MIYTVTFNPSIDYIVQVGDFKNGIVNRSKSEKMFAGGKGINVSIVLHNLKMDSICLGFVAGFTGREIVRRLKEAGIRSEFIEVEGTSRINVKLKSNDETEINGQGPEIDSAALEKLFEKVERLNDGDILVISGSVPNTMPKDIYQQLLGKLQNKKIRTVVDASGELLVKTLKYKPFLIKPNNLELGEIFDTEITMKDFDKAIFYSRKLQEMGARNVLASMGTSGAVLIAENGEVYSCRAPQGKAVNSTGAGDSMVAGFLAGYLTSGGDYQYALKLGVYSGSASAFSMDLATEEEIMALMERNK